MSKVSTKIIYFRIFNECFGQKHVKIGKKLKKTKIYHIKNGQMDKNYLNLDKLDKITFIWTKFLKVSNTVILTFLSTFGQIGQNGQHLRKSHYKFYYFF